MEVLEADKYYHIYNRGNGHEAIFSVPDNYRFFIQKYKLYISPIAHTYCYCLMPNHFHFLIQIKSDKELFEIFGFENNKDISKAISNQFSKFFNSYVKAYNKQQSRMGSLFMKNFKRKIVSDDIYFKKLVHYIHNNPVEANLCDKPEGYKYSSFSEIILNKSTFVKKDELINWFGDLENFIYFHKLSPSLKEME